MSSNQVSMYQQVSNAVGNTYTADQIEMISSSVAKDTTPQELGYFLSVCDSLGLNPFNKEIWCYKDFRGALVMFTGRDGFLKLAQEQSNYAGMRSCEVCENDEFEANIPEGKITHTFTLRDRGKIIGAYAIIFKHSGEPTIEIADIATYYKGTKKDGSIIASSPWNTTTSEMIKKVAESHGLKKAFGFSGLSSEHDFSEEPKSYANQHKTVIPLAEVLHEEHDSNLTYKNSMDLIDPILRELEDFPS